MNQYIKIEDFEQELHQRNFQKVYEIIILKTYDLISELIEEKKDRYSNQSERYKL